MCIRSVGKTNHKLPGGVWGTVRVVIAEPLVPPAWLNEFSRCKVERSRSDF